MNEYLAWFDGACEPLNPGGTASFGVIVKGGNGTVLLRDHGVVGNPNTNSRRRGKTFQPQNRTTAARGC